MRVFLKLFFIAVLIPYFVLAADFLRPKITNYGQYKSVSDLAKKNLHPLFGHVPNDVNNAIIKGPMDGSKYLKLSIVLPLNNEDELDEWLLDLLSPQKSGHREFLSHDDFVKHFGPTKKEVKKVKSYLINNGFKIESVDPNRLIIHTVGKVTDINRIFNTEINHFVDHHGNEFFAPAYELQVEKSIKIQGVQGLENRVKAHSKLKAQRIKNPNLKQNQALSPAQIRTAYSLSNQQTGAGQVLALFELDGFTQSDITAYEQAYNLPNVPIQTILVDNFDGTPGDGAAEVTLDIELMIAIAPGAAKILVYEGPNSGSGLLDTYNKIATDNLAKSVSTSWGLSETSSTGSLIQSESAIFKQMAAQGQTLYAASGDSGAYDNGSSLSVDDPASQPLVVGVGGTTLYLNSNGSYERETTWSSGQGAGQSGGGGGISSIWSIPSWQQGVISAASLGSTTMRNVPDVSFDADPNSGYAIYFNGGWNVYGGTSCAAPIWAAFTALVNEARVSSGQSVLGFPNTILYQLGQSSSYGSIFHDIKDNSNNGYYPAVAGYDLATGWGTFMGDNLLAQLAGNSAPPPPPTCVEANPSISISPSSQQALAGGELTYTISVTNNDNSACSSSSFNLSANAPSNFTQSLQESSLSLSPGQSASTTLILTSPSSSAAGDYNFTVDGANASNSSLSGSASGTYVVEAPQGALSITVNPENGVFRYNSHIYADFLITLKNGSKPLANNINITVEGPNSWSETIKTGSAGAVIYGVYLNSYLPRGTYNMTLSSQYKGASVTHQTSFIVK